MARIVPYPYDNRKQTGGRNHARRETTGRRRAQREHQRLEDRSLQPTGAGTSARPATASPHPRPPYIHQATTGRGPTTSTGHAPQRQLDKYTTDTGVRLHGTHSTCGHPQGREGTAAARMPSIHRRTTRTTRLPLLHHALTCTRSLDRHTNQNGKWKPRGASSRKWKITLRG